MTRPASAASLLGGCLLLAACAVGPDYERPAAPQQTSYKAAETGATAHAGSATPTDAQAAILGWKLAEPADPTHAEPWWQLFDDPELDRLLREVEVSNQTLAQAEARYRQASAALRGARAGFFPSLGSNASYRRQGGGTRTNDQGFSTSTSSSRYDLSIGIDWELDLWGRLRRQLEAERAGIEASAADLAGARLSAQSTLAQSYFELRMLDHQAQLFAETVAAYERSVQLTENQYRAGIVARADVVQAQTQLERTRAQAIDLEWQRSQLENAIAVLTGRPPAALRLAPTDTPLPTPVIPLAVPSTLLERRPDIAAAERAVQAANARIGVAQAAWFPTLSLSAAGGYQSSSYADWLDLPNRYWSLGPQLALTLFDGGARRALKEEAIASYDESVALYRQTVLEGFQAVEDALARVQVIGREIAVQRRAVELAEEAERLVTNQYRAGIVSYLNVITAQATTLESRRSLLALQGDRLAAGVQLIAALGGDWGGLERAGAD